jgi:hypothetical protein
VEQSQQPRGFDGKTYFTLDEMARMLPSPARLMHEVGTRWWKVYYAAKAGNWPLAEYEISEVEELFEICMHTRPRYAQYMEPFLDEGVKKVKEAVAKKDWGAFDSAYQQSVKDANDYHKAAGKELLKWKLPPTPPPDLVMEP